MLININIDQQTDQLPHYCLVVMWNLQLGTKIVTLVEWELFLWIESRITVPKLGLMLEAFHVQTRE
jgi:hypothetical protein